ncbi:MAG: flagellar biosynthetic protein FliR [Alphaproteobacteria bacterium]|nr:flagellar biosynthetic protein FliR [Alphaproteobacteria bacterium]
MTTAGDLLQLAPDLLLASVRPAAALLFLPGFGGPAVPVTVRVALTLAFGAIAAPGLPPGASLSLLAVAQEAVVGAIFGMAAAATLAAASAAGELIATTMGLSFATSVDPGSGASSTILTRFTAMIGGVLFLASGAHVVLFAALVGSYAALPPGQWHLGADTAAALLGMAARAMAAGAAIGLPLTAALLLVNIATGLLARAAPQLNLFAIGLPLTLLAGLAMLVPALPAFAAAVAAEVQGLGDELAALPRSR